MEFQQLEMFVAVVEQGSVRRAAERVFRTAPAVSIALRKLEEEIGGGALFFRGHQELTPAGQLLYDYTKRILSLKREVLSGLQALKQCRIGHVLIGANESTSLYLLPKLTHAFQEAYPGLTLETMCDNSEALIAVLKECQIDLALVAFAREEPTLTKHLIMYDEIVLVTRPGHRLTRSHRVTIKDLVGEVLIAESVKSSLHDEVVQAFQTAKTELNVKVANVSIEGIKRMVAEGVGVGFVPRMCVHEEEVRGELAAIRVDGISRQRELWLVHRNDRSLSAAAEAFLKVALRAAGNWLSSKPSFDEAVENHANSSRSYSQSRRPAGPYC
jgi:DNA-binding transcriptional LysR family regulator